MHWSLCGGEHSLEKEGERISSSHVSASSSNSYDGIKNNTDKNDYDNYNFDRHNLENAVIVCFSQLFIRSGVFLLLHQFILGGVLWFLASVGFLWS